MVKILGVLVCLSVVFIASCGGSGGGSSVYTVTASVALPSAASISSPFKSSIIDAATEGEVVQPKDLAGNDIGSPCTTGVDGTCDISLTAAQLEAGVVFEAANMHSYREYDSSDLALVDSAPLTAPISATEDVVYAITISTCGGDLASCPPTVDPGCLRDAVGVLPDNDEANTSAIDGYIEGLVAAQANAIVNASADATDNLIAALGGNTTGYIESVGSDTVSGVPVADALTNSTLAASTLQSAFCTRPSAGAASPWETARLSASTTDKATFDKAMAGMFEYFTPSELQEGAYQPEDFRGFMTAGPTLDGFFNTVGGSDNDMARRTFVEGFRQGMFADPANAPVATGFLTATFPTPVGGVMDWTGNAYDPTTAGMAGRNAFTDLTNSGTYNPALYTPNMINAGFQPMMGDPTYRSSFANGGGSDFINTFIGNPTGFVPTNFSGQILSPPGGSCTDSSNCLPCDNCVSGRCIAGSSKMGSSCSADSDCDSITLCVGPPSGIFASIAGKNCMCASVVPTGLGVYTGAGSAPQPYGTEGGYTPPSAGSQGGQCGPPPSPACSGGLICTDLVHGGVCAPGTFKFPAGYSCSSGDVCTSGTCTSGVCAAGGSEGGSKPNGQPCAFPNECQSLMCIAGICTAMGGGGGLKPDCSPCTLASECGSNFCSAGMCTPLGGGLPQGAFCSCDAGCLSHHCNFANNTCF